MLSYTENYLCFSSYCDLLVFFPIFFLPSHSSLADKWNARHHSCPVLCWRFVVGSFRYRHRLLRCFLPFDVVSPIVGLLQSTEIWYTLFLRTFVFISSLQSQVCMSGFLRPGLVVEFAARRLFDHLGCFRRQLWRAAAGCGKWHRFLPPSASTTQFGKARSARRASILAE